jgi:hypothetical protein
MTYYSLADDMTYYALCSFIPSFFEIKESAGA